MDRRVGMWKVGMRSSDNLADEIGDPRERSCMIPTMTNDSIRRGHASALLTNPSQHVLLYPKFRLAEIGSILSTKRGFPNVTADTLPDELLQRDQCLDTRHDRSPPDRCARLSRLSTNDSSPEYPSDQSPYRPLHVTRWNTERG